MLRFDLKTIALDIDDAHSLSGRRWTTTRRPDAVADPDPSTVAIDRFDYKHHFSEQSVNRIVEGRIAAVVVACSIGPASAYPSDEYGENRECTELQRNAYRERDRQNTGEDGGRANEHQEEPWGDEFGNQQHDAAD